MHLISRVGVQSVGLINKRGGLTQINKFSVILASIFIRTHQSSMVRNHIKRSVQTNGTKAEI